VQACQPSANVLFTIPASTTYPNRQQLIVINNSGYCVGFTGATFSTTPPTGCNPGVYTYDLTWNGTSSVWSFSNNGGPVFNYQAFGTVTSNVALTNVLTSWSKLGAGSLTYTLPAYTPSGSLQSQLISIYNPNAYAGITFAGNGFTIVGSCPINVGGNLCLAVPDESDSIWTLTSLTASPATVGSLFTNTLSSTYPTPNTGSTSITQVFSTPIPAGTITSPTRGRLNIDGYFGGTTGNTGTCTLTLDMATTSTGTTYGFGTASVAVAATKSARVNAELTAYNSLAAESLSASTISTSASAFTPNNAATVNLTTTQMYINAFLTNSVSGDTCYLYKLEITAVNQ
jgi:hypothetical protein